MNALKAQAVAARSFAIDHLRPLDKAWDVYDDGSSQAYGGIDAERPESDAAVLETANEVLTYEGNVINAVYHSQGGGATEDSRYVWNPADGSPGVDTPYLHGSPDVDGEGVPYDKGGPYDSWRTRTFTLEQLSRIMGADPMTDVGRIERLRMDDRGVSDRLISVTLVGQDGRRRTVAGWYFKSVFNRERRIGDPLLSTLFFLTPVS
jgi:stage II sporulation protein D